MSEQVWSEWFEHKPGEPCPVPDGVVFEFRCRDGDTTPGEYATCWDSMPAMRANEIVSYRVHAPAGFVPPGAEKPWYPPVPEGYGQWVEWSGDGRVPAPADAACQVLSLFERKERRFHLSGLGGIKPTPEFFGRNDNRTGGSKIVAYCLKLEDQPTQEQVEATQKPETPTLDELEDSLTRNRPMFDADDVGVSAGKWDRFNARLAAPTAAPGFMVRDVRSSDGLLTVREADHRLGLWS